MPVRILLDHHWKRLLPILPVAFFGVAVWLLYHEISHYRWHEIEESLYSIATPKICIASGLVVLNFLVLIGYDWLALKAIGVHLELSKVAFASFSGFVASYNFGATLGGVPIRYRIYSAYGLTAIQIIQLSIMLGVTFWIGEFALAGAAFVLAPIRVPLKLHLPFETVYGLGWVLLGIAGIYFTLSVFLRGKIRVGGREFQLPSPKMTMAQFMASASDFVVAAATLYALLPDAIAVSYFQFLCVFLLATIAVVLTHIPGGVGIFELVILTMLGAEANSDVVASLLVFRVIYYLIPLLIAGLMVGLFEYRQRRDLINPVLLQLSHGAAVIAPSLIAGVVLVGGAVLLMSGATPSAESRVRLLRTWLPLPFIEVSHFLGSLVGAAMLVVARGLQRKLDSAWWIASSLAVIGIATSLLKGFDFEEAILLGFVLVILILSRRKFYRKGYLLHQRFTPGWVTAIGLIVLCSLWLGTFAFKHVEYQHELWWQFTFLGDAPRFLRASVGVAAVFLCFMVWRISRRTAPERLDKPSGEEWQAVESIVGQSTKTSANLSLLGDKQFLLSEDRRSFIMYAVERRSWIAMGDPVGSNDQFAELVWKFRETCDRYDGWPVFYQVDKELLSVYLDQGLTLLKIGEEAHVPLSQFSLEGQHRGLRTNRHKLQKAGYCFEVLSQSEVPELLPRLREISDAWLSEKHASEKGFSLGFFSEGYLSRYPFAVVKHDDKIIAFANILQGAQNSELSIDLMRHVSNGPNGLMDFLFTELLLWGKAEGFQRFSMGMAPLSGLDSRPLAPLWNKAINLVYKHGDHFYSFEGLRQYKQKFDPVWTPKYLASPGGLALPRILADLAQLIGRTKPTNVLSKSK